MKGVGGAPRAPRERQTAAAGLYSGVMMMQLPYRPASAPAIGFGAAIFKQGDLRPPSSAGWSGAAGRLRRPRNDF